jgi:hypothetical protein
MVRWRCAVNSVYHKLHNLIRIAGPQHLTHHALELRARRLMHNSWSAFVRMICVEVLICVCLMMVNLVHSMFLNKQSRYKQAPSFIP